MLHGTLGHHVGRAWYVLWKKGEITDETVIERYSESVLQLFVEERAMDAEGAGTFHGTVVNNEAEMDQAVRDTVEDSAMAGDGSRGDCFPRTAEHGEVEIAGVPTAGAGAAVVAVSGEGASMPAELVSDVVVAGEEAMVDGSDGLPGVAASEAVARDGLHGVVASEAGTRDGVTESGEVATGVVQGGGMSGVVDPHAVIPGEYLQLEEFVADQEGDDLQLDEVLAENEGATWTERMMTRWAREGRP